MNCLIVDDQGIFRTMLKKLLDLDDGLKLMGECESAAQAYQKIRAEQIDLVFLDIRMHGMSGIELAELLADKRPMIIFTTSMKEYAAEAFDLNVVDFLVKPISPVRFIKAVEKARKIFDNKNMILDQSIDEFVFIRDSNVVRRLRINDILYFEATGDYVRVKLSDQDYFIYSSLKAIGQKLPEKLFLRVHRSFIINLGKIDSMEGRTLVVNKHLIPVSDAYRSELNRRMLFL